MAVTFFQCRMRHSPTSKESSPKVRLVPSIVKSSKQVFLKEAFDIEAGMKW